MPFLAEHTPAIQIHAETKNACVFFTQIRLEIQQLPAGSFPKRDVLSLYELHDYQMFEVVVLELA